jgi:uncharacterized membrane protein YozB (DUF420 family)
LDIYQLEATISLTIQIVVLVLLSGSVWLEEKKKYRQHGILMLIAVVLHTAVVLAWMIPLFSSMFSFPINTFEPLVAAVLIHAFTGIATIILGFWLVGSWRLKVDVKGCFRKKKVMLATISLWLTTLSIGIIMYLKIVLGF